MQIQITYIAVNTASDNIKILEDKLTIHLLNFHAIRSILTTNIFNPLLMSLHKLYR